MCKATHEAGGPMRCSGDARNNLERSTTEVSALERVEAALEAESDASLFEPVLSPAGHSLQVRRMRWYGVRTHGVYCGGCDDMLTPPGGFTSPADANAWARSYAAASCAPGAEELDAIGPGDQYSSASPAEFEEMQRERSQGVHRPRVQPTRYRGLQTWSVYCAGCDDWLGPAGGFGQAGEAQQWAKQGCSQAA